MTGQPKILKLKFSCANCGLYLGDYWGETFYLMPANNGMNVLCKRCMKLFSSKGGRPKRGRPAKQYQRIQVTAFADEEEA